MGSAYLQLQRLDHENYAIVQSYPIQYMQSHLVINRANVLELMELCLTILESEP